jgi:hypothetical protein
MVYLAAYLPEQPLLVSLDQQTQTELPRRVADLHGELVLSVLLRWSRDGKS